METIAAVNALDRDAFVARFGAVFEHSPWVAERVWSERPFTGLDDLHARMVAVMERASRDEQLALIRAHPELLGRLAQARLSAESLREQGGAGLTEASERETAELTRLNAAYRERFGFPFILAVRGVKIPQIVASLTQRLPNTPEQEFATCLAQIGRIARFRLGDMVAG